jgi:hypothetical protein
MERCAEQLLRTTDVTVDDLHLVTLADVPESSHKEALLRRRAAIGLGAGPAARLVVDEEGRALAAEDVPLRLRFAKSVRISMEGNAHFCRGLLATRYGSTT